MARLTPDARIPRWIAAGYSALAAGIVALAVLAYAYLDRQERDRLRLEMEAAATEAAARLGPDLARILDALPERAGDPNRALPFVSRAASLPAPAEIHLAVRLRQAELLARPDLMEAGEPAGKEAAARAAEEAEHQAEKPAGKEHSKAAYLSILEDLAGLCESWGKPEPRPLTLEAARLFAGKAAAALRDMGEAGTPATLERIDEALRSRGAAAP